jgi:hypothetical protein
MDLIKGYKINFSLQACMYLFIIIHLIIFTKPRKIESTLAQIETNRENKINDRNKKQK